MSRKFHFSLLGRPVRSSLFYSFIASYLFVLFIPLFCAAAVFYRTEEKMKEELLHTNEAILIQCSQIIDQVFSELDTFNLNFALNSSVSTILHIRPPFNSAQRYNINTVIRKELSSRPNPSCLVNFYVYFAKGDFVLTPTANYTTDLAFEQLASPYFQSEAEWLDAISGAHFKTVLNADNNTLLYIQSLPYTGSAAASIVATIDKAALLSQLDSIEWVRQNLLLVCDREGEPVLSNHTGEEPAKDEGPGSVYLSEQTGWTYRLYMRSEYLASSSQPLHNIFLFFFAGTLAAGVLAAWIFSRKNYIPIRNVTHLLRGSLPAAEEKNELLYLDASVRKMLNLNADITRQLAMQQDQVRQNYLSRMLRGRIDLRYLDAHALALHGISFPKPNFVVALFRVDEYERYFGEMPAGQDEYPLDSMDFSLIMLLQELIQARYAGYVCEVNGVIASVINYDSLRVEEVAGQLAEIRSFVFQTLFIELTVSISAGHRSVAGLSDAYEEASLALEQSIFSRENSCNILQYVAGASQSHYGYTPEREQSLAGSLRSGNLEQCRAILRELSETCFAENALSSPELLHCFLYDIAATFIRAGEELGISEEKFDAGQFLNGMSGLRGTGQIESYLDAYAEKICGFVESGRESHNNRLLRIILDYLWENYADKNLSNDQIAEAAGISSAYLSRFFKQQTGEGLLNYINRIRIEQAKALLASPMRQTVQEIGQQVGFENSATFIRIFKKQEGLTPGRYQELKTRE